MTPPRQAEELKHALEVLPPVGSVGEIKVEDCMIHSLVTGTRTIGEITVRRLVIVPSNNPFIPAALTGEILPSHKWENRKWPAGGGMSVKLQIVLMTNAPAKAQTMRDQPSFLQSYG